MSWHTPAVVPAPTAVSATLSIVSDAPNSPHNVALLGTVYPTGTPHLTVSATSLDFGTVTVGGDVTRTLTITNSGTGVVFLAGGIQGPNVNDFFFEEA